MTAVASVHHINFIFADLDTAVRRFAAILGRDDFIVENLPGRDVRTARICLGDTWIVLVSPLDRSADTAPANHLRQHGEGFFLLSLGVPDLEAAIDRLAAEGSAITLRDLRQGIADWRIADLPAGESAGICLQLAALDDGDSTPSSS